jgi:hypothetical protein
MHMSNVIVIISFMIYFFVLMSYMYFRHWSVDSFLKLHTSNTYLRCDMLYTDKAKGDSDIMWEMSVMQKAVGETERSCSLPLYSIVCHSSLRHFFERG